MSDKNNIILNEALLNKSGNFKKANESILDLTVVSESKEMQGSEEFSLTGRDKISEKVFLKSKNNVSLERRSFEDSKNSCELIDLINKNGQSNKTLKEQDF